MLGFGAIGEAAIGDIPDWVRVEDIKHGMAAATLTVGTLIVPEKSVGEGVLIRSYGWLWNEIARHLGRDWSLAFQIPPDKWEEMIAGAFNRQGSR